MGSLERAEESTVSNTVEQDLPKSLYQIFHDARDEGLLSTHLKPDALASYIPKNLKSAYDLAMNRAGEKKFQDTPENREMVDYLRNDIFGLWPAYTAPINLDHTKGFVISGMARNVLMDKKVAWLEIRSALTGLTAEDVVKRAMNDFGRALNISPAELKRAVTGTLNSGANRQMVSNLVKTAKTMQSEALGTVGPQ